MKILTENVLDKYIIGTPRITLIANGREYSITEYTARNLQLAVAKGEIDPNSFHFLTDNDEKCCIGKDGSLLNSPVKAYNVAMDYKLELLSINNKKL